MAAPKRVRCILMFFCLSSAAVAAHAQGGRDEFPSDTIHLADTYVVTPDITYRSVNGYEAKLDVYQHAGKTPRLTLMYIHGGAWRDDRNKDQFALWLVPYMQLGWNVVNVEYRSSGLAAAPAGVEDCLCALHWIFQNAGRYGFDPRQIVVMGNSAGSDLALMVGMTPPDSNLQKACPHSDTERVAAIVDWFGVTDVAELIEGPNKRAWAKAWIGSEPGALKRAQSVSPLNYVRPGLPPTIIIHGDGDPVVPYQQSVKLNEALEKASVPHELVTVRSAKHGFTDPNDRIATSIRVFQFLKKNGLDVYPDKPASATVR